MRPDAILFDLDGTLLDSSADLAAAVNAARAVLGYPPLAPAAVEGGVGWGLGHLLQHVLPRADHARLPALREAFIAYALAHPVDLGRSFPGAEAVLAAWPAARLGLVTNKPRMFTAPILARLGWTARFGVVIAGDDLPARKPDPAPLRAALERLKVAPAAALFVGDSEVDAAAAAAAGVAFAAVPWGREAPRAPWVLTGLEELVPLAGGGAP